MQEKEITHYRLIQEYSLSDFKKEVLNQLSQGFELYGEIKVTNTVINYTDNHIKKGYSRIIYTREMVKYSIKTD